METLQIKFPQKPDVYEVTENKLLWSMKRIELFFPRHSRVTQSSWGGTSEEAL